MWFAIVLTLVTGAEYVVSALRGNRAGA